MPLWTGAAPLQLCFYTAGSANETRNKAASAIFLVVVTANGREFGGYHSFKPVQSTTAQAAEQCAIFGAVMWALNIVSLRNCHPHVAFYFDCFAAGYSAAGWWNSPSSPVAPITRALVLWLEELVGICHWEHTAAHSHIPGNEAADAISKHAWFEDGFTCEIDTIWKLCTFDGKCPWVCEWLLFLERQLHCPTSAPLLIGQDLWYNVRAPFAHEPNPDLQAFHQHILDQGSCHTSWFRVQAATANVLSLFPTDHGSGCYISARAESLLKQFDECSIDVIGFQETRSKAFGHSQHGAFHILSASANSKGHFGVQLWIRSTIQGPHGVMTIAPQHLRIVAHDPRFLIVQFHHGDMQVLFIVAHAPCEDTSDATDRFWQMVNHYIPSHCHGWTTVALVDANARLGNLTSSHVGDHQADVQNHNGQVLHNWLSHNDLYLPQTFETCHRGSASIWTHPKGTSARLDFIALSKDIDRMSTTSWIDDRIDLSIVRADHLCVCAQFWIQGQPRQSKHSVRRKKHDVPSSQSFMWSTNIHDHAAILQSHISAANPKHTTPKCRKPHLQESTWELIQYKKWHHKQAKRVTQTWRLGMLRAIFSAWKDHQAPCQSSTKWQKECCFSIEWHTSQSKSYALQAKKACRQDDITFFEQLAQDTANAIFESPAEVWNAVRPMLPKTRKKRASTLRCAGPTVAERCKHFSDLEAGEFHSFTQALRSCHVSQKHQTEEAPLQVPLCNLPSRPAIERICRSVWKFQGVELAESIGQLLAKMWLTSTEPFQFKGGRLHCLAKHSGSHRVEDTRGIMILDGLGKIYHAYLRRKLMETAVKWRQPLQLGGYAHQQTLYGTHYLRTELKTCSSKGLSTGILFIDLRSAFHTLLRDHLMGPSHAMTEKLHDILSQTGFDVSSIQQEAQQHSAWFQADVPVDVQRALQDAHQSTWFFIEGESQVCVTDRGSRPGSPLADLAFNAVVSHLIHDVQQAVNALPDMMHARSILGMDAPILSWADDIAIPMMATTASQLPHVVAKVTGIVYDACQTRGLSLNFKPGKTEVVCTFRGKDSAAVKRQHLVENLGHLQLTHPDVLLRIVGNYEHLGTQFQQSGSITHEINVRIGKAHSAMQSIKKTILGNRKISVQARIRLVEALIVPVLMHGSGNWPVLNRHTFLKLQRVLMTWFRSIANDGHWSDHQSKDRDFLAQWSIPDLKARLNKARLLYGFQMMQHAPSQIVDFVSAVDGFDDKEWMFALRDAIHWASTIDETLQEGVLVDMTTESVFQWLSMHALHGPQTVRRCLKKHVALEKQMYDIRILHLDLVSIAQRGGV